MDETPRPVPGFPPRVILVGFMTAGKTSVGRRLAARLGRRFIDLDAEIERAAGSSIPVLFASAGEAAFRDWEARVTRSLPDDEPFVLAAGGGWMCRPELRDRWPDAVRVWLRVSPAEAMRRLEAAPSARPLLAVEEPARAIETLLAERTAAYRMAEIHLETDGRDPEEVTEAALGALAGATPPPDPA
ncbi:MAG: shikimate kinase [Gemmatimonadota bacterium]